ncbi:MAG: hypothetical protein ACW97Z_06025 [Candidatus Hodarchaeales archaeon]
MKSTNKSSHSHEAIALRKELLELLENASIRIEFLSAAATPLVSVATSASILTFLSIQFFFNGTLLSTRLIAGINILLLLSMVFISLITQIMIHRARLRLARVKHDLNIEKILDSDQFNSEEHQVLIKLSHLALKSRSTIDRVQWLYNHGLFQFLFLFITLTVAGLLVITISEIPLRV